MPQWDLNELREFIRAERSDSEELLDIVHSIDRYNWIFLFHLDGARDALHEVIDVNNPDQKEAMSFVLGASGRQDEYHLAKIASEAHILGAAHSARAIYDVFAFLVNRLLLENCIPENRCNIQLLAAELPSSCIKYELETLIESYWFGYMSAFASNASPPFVSGRV